MEPNQDNTVSSPAAAGPALAPAAPPRSKLYRVMWGIFGIIALVLGVTQMYSGLQGFFVLPSCDSQRAKDTLSGIFKEQKFEPTGYDSIKTVSTSKDEVACNAVLPLPDGANLVADYSFYWEGNTAKIKYSMHRKAP